MEVFNGADGVSLKSSAPIQSACDMTLLSTKSDCKIKAVKIEDDVAIGETGSGLGNYGDGMTSASLNGSKDESSMQATLKLAIPNSDFGLLMIYAKRASDSRNDKTKAFFSAAADGECLREFNSDSEQYAEAISWDGDGMKVLQIKCDATTLTLKAEEGVKISLVFSNLDIVPTTES